MDCFVTFPIRVIPCLLGSNTPTPPPFLIRLVYSEVTGNMIKLKVFLLHPYTKNSLLLIVSKSVWYMVYDKLSKMCLIGYVKSSIRHSIYDTDKG